MSLYIKNGTVKSLHKIVLIKDDMQIFNPTPEMVEENGWVKYIAKEFTEEEWIGGYDGPIVFFAFQIEK